MGRGMSCYYGVVAQLVERVLSMHEALGSTPSNSIIFIIITYGFTITMAERTHRFHYMHSSPRTTCFFLSSRQEQLCYWQC